MRLVLLSFGDRLDVHTQAAFCLLSFLKADPGLAVVVVSDRPALYAHFGAAVQVLPTNTAQLQQWQQPHGFFWRVKLRALQEVAIAFPGDDLLYVDADTMLVTGLDRLKASLAAGRPLMHLPEHRLCQAPTKTERQNWQVLRGQAFGGIEVNAQTVMWNAGVIGVPGRQAAEALALALAACDAMCETPARRRLLEQLAFSMALDAVGPLADARAEILHYWGNKPAWQNAIHDFWLRSRLENRTLAQDLAAFNPQDHLARPIEHSPRRWVQWLQRLGAGQAPRRQRLFGE